MKSERRILELIVQDIRLPENVRRNADKKLEGWIKMFETDEDALDLLYRYGHEEKENGILRLDWLSLNGECKAAVQYLCDEWDFCVLPMND